MNTSGRPREGWMAIVPLAFFTFFVIAAAGGPRQFVKSASYWISDFVAACVRWVEGLV